ncbi:MAG TPA: tetratricopeptide repeat protein, partial [Fimbriiglobus sp.]|nr:tetratricopeptide repeat protein [Fimbriiglobus sp.]
MSTTKYRVNWKFLGVVVAGLAAVAVGTHLRYRQQVGSQAGVLVHLAGAAEAEGELGKAVGYLRRYLVYAPDDTDTRARFGLLLGRLARTSREPLRLQSYMVLDEVLRRDPTRDDVRRRAAELALVLGPKLLPDAERHLKALTDSPKQADGELWALYANYHLLRNEWKLAADKLKTATDRKPDLYAAYVRRALVRREHLHEGEDADKQDIENGLLGPTANRNAAPAHLAAAAYWHATGREERRAAAVERASRLAPDDLDVLLAVADLAQDRGKAAARQPGPKTREAVEAEWAKARTALQRGIDRYAGSVGDLTAEAVADLDDAGRLRRAQVGELFQRLTRVEVRSGDLAAADRTAERAAKLLPESAALQLTLADVRIRRGQFDQATVLLDKVEKTKALALAVKFHRGRILAGKKEWLAAARTLEEVMSENGLAEEFVTTGSLLLGTCYERLGELDRRHAAYNRAVAATDPSDPLWATVNERLASTLVEMGQGGEAIKVYERLAERVPDANVQLGRLLLAEVLRKPRDKRDWARVEQVIQAAPEGPVTAVLRADLQVSQGKLPTARETLLAATRTYADAAPAWIALALLEHKDNKPDRAREVLETARGKFGPTVEIQLTEARILTFPTTPQTAAGLTRLADGAARLSNRDARRLLKGLSELATAAGDADLASRFLERLTALAPGDLPAHLASFDDALRRKDDAAAQALLKHIQDIDAPGGTTALAARAVYLIWKAQNGDRSRLAEAEELLSTVRRQRPWWTRAILGQALLADLKGDAAAAAAKYREAVDAGERRPDVIERLLELYADRQQYREAEEVLDKLRDGPGTLAGNDLLVSELSARAGNLKRALEAAERAVSATESDPRKLLWLSQLRRVAKESAERVEQPIRRAVQVAGDRPGPWVALVQYLVATDRKPEAEKQLKEAERRLGGKHAFAVAQCYEAVGNFDRARSLYASALKESPSDVATLRGAAAFYLRANDTDTVKQLCQKMLAVRDLSAEDRLFAVRLLGVIVSVGGDYQAARKTLESVGILEHGVPTRLTGQETVAQLQTRAVVLAVQTDPRLRREALDAFERIEARQPLAPDDQFLYARLLASVGEWP